MRRSGTGTVYLVGAGPDNPALLALPAAEPIRTADEVAHYAPIPPRDPGRGPASASAGCQAAPH